MRLSPKVKAEIGKRASECGTTSTIRYFAKKYPDLKESSVRTWKNAYINEVKQRRKCGEDFEVKEIPEKKKGCPYLLGEELEMQLEHIYGL